MLSQWETRKQNVNHPPAQAGLEYSEINGIAGLIKYIKDGIEMKNLIKAIACVTAIALLLCTTAFAVEFTDMPQGAAGEVIMKAVENGLLTGFEDQTVRPDAEITRAQMAAIMVRALGAEKTADISAFSDMSEDKWYYKDMAKAVFMEAFKGDGEKLNPENSITRQEAFIVLSRIFYLPEAEVSVLDSFSDGGNVSDWAKQEVSKIAAGGYVDAGELRPLDKMTRLEFATVMDKLVSVYITEKTEFTKENLPAGNILIKTDGVSFKDVDVTQNVFIGDGVTGTTTFKNCNTKRVIIRGGKCEVDGGKHHHMNALGDNTVLSLANKPVADEDGIKSFFATPGKGIINISLGAVNVQ